MAFTLNLTGSVEVDDSIRDEFDTEFRLAFAEQGAASQFATLKRDIGAKSISLPKYEQLGLATTPLDENEDVESEAMSDSAVIITPQEYGKVVTTTKLANLQTGGMADRAAARLVGINAGRTMNKLATLALDAGTNVLIAGGHAGINLITATDTVDGSLLGKAYNKLARKNVPGLAGGDYFLIAHDDVIQDIREQSGANSWIDAHKYAMPEALLRNEVGMYKGFRVIRDNLSTINADAGAAGTVDVYHSYALGFNALGLAVSQDVEMRATGPFDKLSRFVNMGWHACWNYKVVEQDALVVIKSASSVGDNV
jgi:N4-gp56 family major capsid protein